VLADEGRQVLGLGGQKIGAGQQLLIHVLSQIPELAEHVGVLLAQGHPAGRTVHDHRVHILSCEIGQHLPDARQGGLPGPGQEDGDPAAALGLGDLHLHPHGGKHAKNASAHIPEKVVGRAPVEIEHPSPALPLRPNGFGGLLRERDRIEGGNPLQGQTPHPGAGFQPTAEEAPRPSPHAGRAGGHPWMGQQLEERPFLPLHAVALGDAPAQTREELITVDPAGAGRRAGPAQEAAGKDLLHSRGYLQTALEHVAGQLHLSPGARRLHQQFCVDRTGRHAKPALVAVVDVLLGAVAEKRLSFHAVPFAFLGQ